jgi:oligopeptidase B
MLDPSLPLTVGEYEEWGNPTDDPAAYATIKAYAPYENVVAVDGDGSPHCYPPMLLTGGLNDTRVGFWEPAKFAAKLRTTNPENPVLLRTEMGVGHGGPSGRYDSWKEEAFVMAWLLERLGV